MEHSFVSMAAFVCILSLAFPARAAVPSPASRQAKAAVENCVSARKDFGPLLDGKVAPAGFVKATWEAQLGTLRYLKKTYVRYRDQALGAEPSLRTSDQQVAGMVLKEAWDTCDPLFENYEKRLEELAASWQAKADTRPPPQEAPAPSQASPTPPQDASADTRPTTIEVGFRNETEENVCEVWVAPANTENWSRLPSITWLPGPGALRTAKLQPGRYGLWFKQCGKSEPLLKEPSVDLTVAREVVVLGSDRTAGRPSSDWDANARLILKTQEAKKPRQNKPQNPCMEDRTFCLSACGTNAQQCDIDCLHNQGQSPACYQKCRERTDHCREACRGRFASCR